jgi:hypothetical protein
MALEQPNTYDRTALVQEVLYSPGSLLDPDVRAPMESRFGRDFGHVRLHTDDQAAASARALNARAYTVGAHIVFGQGRYSPGTRKGLWLLAHELAHVVQQRGEVAKDLVRPPRLGDADDALERAADHAASLIAAGRPLPSDFDFGAAPAGVIQRHADESCPLAAWPVNVTYHLIPLAEHLIELNYYPQVFQRIVSIRGPRCE